ncbi:hypothetical protein BDW22DRAFT_1169338 [Trametopsis cervina]|nr:hypothetical protein BDW22DRAFT_1169338 [Trametopsis cervina]
MWALLISIENYKNKSWPAVLGAHRDNDNTYQYLTNDLKVPEDHIVILKDSSASRTSIISAFEQHLINNTRIARGDAILLHYSGHGTRVRAPEGWTVIEKKTGQERVDNLVEAIVPWDADGLTDRRTELIYSIPDRTLAGLIRKAADAHGDNITIVLDSCCSGHGTRSGGNRTACEEEEELVSRGIDLTLGAPLPVALDDDLVPEIAQKVGRSKEGRIRALSADHVLMAACGPLEEARGGARSGGIFTTQWLKALRRTDIFPRTYAEILKHVDTGLEPIRRKHRFVQNPQCEGIVRDRLVFEETRMRADHYDALHWGGTGTNTLEISAGEIHGVEVGTLFEIHVMDGKLQSERMLGTAIARRVDATRSMAEVGEGVSIGNRKYTAVVTQQPERLNYILANDAPHSNASQTSIATFRNSVANASPNGVEKIREVAEGTNTDLFFSAGEDGSLTLRRLDPLLVHIPNKAPTISPKEVKSADFVGILQGIARFNRLLALTSVTHPFADLVSFEMCRLRRQGRRFSEDQHGFIRRATEPPLEIVDEEALVEEGSDDNEIGYAIILRNNTSKNLFAYAWFFDPNTYCIEACYTPSDPGRPCLYANGGQLQIGASTERGRPLQFYLPSGATRDTVFVKVFLTDRPTKLDFLQQDGLIGEDGEGESIILNKTTRRSGERGVETKGRWDTISRKITVIAPSEVQFVTPS